MHFYLERLVAVFFTVYGLIFINNSVVCCCFTPIFFTMQDNFDDLWMNHLVFLWVDLTNSGLAFDRRALGQLPHYIISHSNSYRVHMWRFLCTTSEKCACCEAGISGTYISDLPLDKSLWWWFACLFAFAATVLNFVQVNFPGLHACGALKLSHFLPQTVRGQNPRCHGLNNYTSGSGMMTL